MGVLPKGMVLDVPAILHLDSWAGRRTYHIRITGETRENSPTNTAPPALSRFAGRWPHLMTGGNRPTSRQESTTWRQTLRRRHFDAERLNSASGEAVRWNDGLASTKL